MQIKIEKAALAARLATAARISGKGQAGFRSLILSAAEGELKIMATDGSIEFCGKVPAEVQEPGETAVCGKFLHNLVKRLPAWPLTLKTDGTGSIVLKSEKLKYTLAAEAAWDSENLALEPPAGGLAVGGAMLAEAIDRVLFCVGRDAGMEGISCLKIDPDPKSEDVALVGLDGHQLARTLLRDATLRSLLPDAGLLLHWAYVDELRRWLPPGGVQVAVGAKRLHFRTAEEMFSLPISDWSYPSFRTLLSKAEAAPSRLEAGREALLAALDRLALFTTEIMRGAVLIANADGVTLSAQADQGKAEEALVSDFQGDPVHVALPVKPLADMLRNLTSDRVRLDICGEEGPCLITGQDDGDWDYALILMPLIIKD